MGHGSFGSNLDWWQLILIGMLFSSVFAHFSVARRDYRDEIDQFYIFLCLSGALCVLLFGTKVGTIGLACLGGMGWFLQQRILWPSVTEEERTQNQRAIDAIPGGTRRYFRVQALILICALGLTIAAQWLLLDAGFEIYIAMPFGILPLTAGFGLLYYLQKKSGLEIPHSPTYDGNKDARSTALVLGVGALAIWLFSVDKLPWLVAPLSAGAAVYGVWHFRGLKHRWQRIIVVTTSLLLLTVCAASASLVTTLDLEAAYAAGLAAALLGGSATVAIRYGTATADRRRIAAELEQARTLQLSLLPTSTPEAPALLCAWSMQTATEVGGDYYDYSLTDDGTLTLCVGDATGHGMDSGVVVTGTMRWTPSFGQPGSGVKVDSMGLLCCPAPSGVFLHGRSVVRET